MQQTLVQPGELLTYTLAYTVQGNTLVPNVVITDALMMKAVAERFGYAKSAVMAIEAGADMVLAQGSPEEQLVAIHALREAFASGRLSRARRGFAAARSLPRGPAEGAFSGRAVCPVPGRGPDRGMPGSGPHHAGWKPHVGAGR